MSYTVKNNISFSEYEAIVNTTINGCFEDSVYNPTRYELSLRVFLIKICVPDFDLSDCKKDNDFWEKVTSEEAENVIELIKETKYYTSLKSAIDNGINHRLRAIEASPMSLSDIALSKLIDVVTAKVNNIDTEVLNKDTINALINADKQSGKENFEKRLVEEMIAQGLISKPNRATRRSTTKKNKDGANIIKIDTTNSESQ